MKSVRTLPLKTADQCKGGLSFLHWPSFSFSTASSAEALHCELLLLSPIHVINSSLGNLSVMYESCLKQVFPTGVTGVLQL